MPGTDTGLLQSIRAFTSFIKNYIQRYVFRQLELSPGGNFSFVNAVHSSSIFSVSFPTVISNLFFAGEVMDVDGITGGFNFQHAWTSGFIAAKNIAGL